MDQELPTTKTNVIYSYSREQAIKDGELVDITQTSEAFEAGFKIPVCVTRNLWGKINGYDDDGQDPKGRLWDVCFMAALAFKGSRNSGKDSRLVEFKVKFYEDKSPKILWLCFDEREGFTLMFPEDY